MQLLIILFLTLISILSPSSAEVDWTNWGTSRIDMITKQIHGSTLTEEQKTVTLSLIKKNLTLTNFSVPSFTLIPGEVHTIRSPESLSFIDLLQLSGFKNIPLDGKSGVYKASPLPISLSSSFSKTYTPDIMYASETPSSTLFAIQLSLLPNEIVTIVTFLPAGLSISQGLLDALLKIVLSQAPISLSELSSFGFSGMHQKTWALSFTLEWKKILEEYNSQNALDL